MAGRFRNREDAGDRLAERLRTLKPPSRHREPPVVLGLPRGGVPVAARVASALGAPLDVLVIRKIGVPWQPELALGAVGEGGARVLNLSIIASSGLTGSDVEALTAKAAREVAERLSRFRGGREAVPLEGREAILVDDGIATGATMRAAVDVARARGAKAVTVAVPVAAAESLTELRAGADDVVSLLVPKDLRGVGLWYADFRQTENSEVVALLSAAWE